jgi:hypothetical protein
VEEMIASEAYPDFVGAYWKGTLTPKASSSDSHRLFAFFQDTIIATIVYNNGTL